MATEQFTFVDRYSATGREYPSPETVCLGHCEGMGCFPWKLQPFFVTDDDIKYNELWRKAHAKNCNLKGLLKNLWQHWEYWYWKSVGYDIYLLLKGKEFCDGYHFIHCPDCDGTGKRPTNQSP